MEVTLRFCFQSGAERKSLLLALNVDSGRVSEGFGRIRSLLLDKAEPCKGSEKDLGRIPSNNHELVLSFRTQPPCACSILLHSMLA